MRASLARRFLISTRRLNTTDANAKPTIGSVNTVDQLGQSVANVAPTGLAGQRSLSQIEQIYMNKINERNQERYLKEKKIKLHYRVTATLLVGFVLSVYFYSMFAIRQEKFLDDFDVPEPPDPAVKTFKNK